MDSAEYITKSFFILHFEHTKSEILLRLKKNRVWTAFYLQEFLISYNVIYSFNKVATAFNFSHVNFKITSPLPYGGDVNIEINQKIPFDRG